MKKLRINFPSFFSFMESLGRTQSAPVAMVSRDITTWISRDYSLDEQNQIVRLVEDNLKADRIKKIQDFHLEIHKVEVSLTTLEESKFLKDFGKDEDPLHRHTLDNPQIV